MNILTLNPPFLVKIRLKFNLRIFGMLNFILLIILFFLYIFQSSSLTKDIYQVEDYKRKLELLSKENEFLEVNFSKSNSLSKIENFLSNQSFIKSNKVKYIQILESSVVAK